MQPSVGRRKGRPPTMDEEWPKWPQVAEDAYEEGTCGICNVSVPEGSEDSRLCQLHSATYFLGFSYLTIPCCLHMYNKDEKFRECFDQATSRSENKDFADFQRFLRLP